MLLSTNNYEYVNEDTIDDELICSICTQPFQSPVSLDCKHIFCQSCIEVWIKQNASCPICRRQFGTGYALTKVTSPTVCNQLDCLLVRCLRCKKSAIQRVKFNGHFRRCSKSKITRASDLLRNRWHSMRTMTRTKHHRQTTPHPTTATRVMEALHIRREQRDALDQNRPEVPFRTHPQQQRLFSNGIPHVPQRATTARSYEPIRNRYMPQTFERKRKVILYICILILAICLWTIFGKAIIAILKILGRTINVLFAFWLWKKQTRAN